MSKKNHSTFTSVYIIFFVALTLLTVILIFLPKLKNNIANPIIDRISLAFQTEEMVETEIALYDETGNIVNIKATTQDSERTEGHNALKALFEVGNKVAPYISNIPASWRFLGFTVDKNVALIRLSENVLKDQHKPNYKNAIMQIKSTVQNVYPNIQMAYLVFEDEIIQL